VAADGRAGAEPLATDAPDGSLSAAPDGLVSAAAGTTFGGALHDADPVAVAAAVRDALDTGLLPAGAVADPDAGTVTLDTSAGPVTVTLTVTSLPPGTTAAPVATIATHADGATVRVSDRASADHVRRAVAAALAEVDALAQERADGLRTDATTALAEGSRPEGDGQRHLTARDIGRLAELRTVADQLAQAGTGRHADPAQVAQLHAEAVGLLISSGLLEPYPGHRVHSLVPNVPVVGSAATDARFAAVRTQLGPAFADLAGLLAAARDRPGLADEIRVVQADVRAAARRWAAQATDARDQADLALTDRVDAALDADPQHVFDRLVIGGGWAAMADFATLDAPPDTGDGLPPVLAVSQGHDPWADRQQLLMGQVPSELEIPGLPFQPADFADEGTQFALSSDFAAAVGAARAYTGMPSYQGTATAILPRPTSAADAAGWPADANYRVTVGERSFYAASVDIAAGPGPARVPAAPASTTGRYVDPATGYQVDRTGPIPVFRDPTGAAVDPATLPTPVRTVLGGTDIDTPTGRGTGQDDPPLLADTAGRLTDPLVVDPASGYAVDAGTGQVYAPDGSPVDPAALPVGVARRLGFDAAGRFTASRSARPRVDFGGQNLADAYQPGDRVLVFGAGASGAWDIEQAAASPAATIDWSARAVGLPPADRTGDPARDAELQFQRSFSGGYNRRNTLPDVGAYDVAATDSRISQSLREIVSTRHTVDDTFLVEFSDGTRQEYDRVVFSIGQAPEYPGGVAALAGALRLRPLHGPPALDRSTPDVIGLTDRSGQLRILGAAAVARQLGPSLGRFSDYLQDRLSDQAAALPDDSRNIPPSIRFHAQRIAEANRSSVPPPSHLPEVDESPPPGDGGVEPGQRPVRGGDPLGDLRDVDVDRILPADGVEAGTVGNEFGAVAREVDKSQVGQDSGGEFGEQFGTDRGNTAVDQPQPAEPPQVRRGQQGAQPVVADRVVVQSEAGEPGQHGARGDLTDQVRADVGEQDVADRNPAVDARAPVEEVGTGQLDQLGEATTYPAVVDEPGDPRTEPRLERDGESMHSPGQLGRDRGTGDLGPVVLDLQSDELGMVGVGGFDGVGVAQPQVHVVGVGEDGGVQSVADGSPAVAGVGHDRSVATPPPTPSEVPRDDGGRSPATDRTAGRDGKSDRTASVRVRLAGEGDTVDRAAGDGGARRDGLLHHRPVGDGDGAQQPADTGGHEAVRGGEAAGPDQRSPDLAASRDSGPADARLTRIRQLAAHYTAADPGTRLALRAEIGVLVDQLGLTGGTPQAYARWAQLPPDLANLLLRLTSPALAPETVLAVLGADPATLTEPQRAQQRDYRARLVHNGYVPYAPQLTEQLHRLAVDAEQGQRSLPMLPASAGQVIGLRPDQLAQLQAVDPALAARIAREGVYVDLTGQVDIGPYALANAPHVDVGGVHPGFDLATDAGRRALLAEDVRRAYATITATYGSSPAITQLLGSHSFHYLAQTRTMVLVSDALTRAILNLAPSAPVEPAPEVAPLAVGPTEIHVYADHPTLPEPDPGEVAPEYGRPVDPNSGAAAPLWNGLPRREQVAQGALGDCGMLASIGAVAGHSPQTIGNLFRPNPDGTVDVLLHESSLPGDRTTPTGRRLRITVTPDVPVHAIMPGQAAYADQAQVGAAWASMLEKALAAVDRTWTESRQVAWQQQWQSWQGWSDPNQAAPRGYARMNPGSTSDLWAEVLTQLTGESARADRFPTHPGSEPTVEATLAQLLARRIPVIVSTMPPDRYQHLPNGTPPYGLHAGHAYEVVAARDGYIWLRNPWNHGHPQPIPVRAFLDLMSRDYAHLDRAPVVPPLPPVPPVAKQASWAGGSTAEVRVGASAGVATNTALTAAGPGRTVTERGGAYFVYYADRGTAGELAQLLAVEVGPAGPRSIAWDNGSATPGAGTGSAPAHAVGRWPVNRTEAEQVARSELGFELPDEPTLHEMLGG